MNTYRLVEVFLGWFKRYSAMLVLVLLSSLFVTPASAQSATGFQPQIVALEPVNAVDVQPDGKVVIGGAFQLGPRMGIVRLLVNGAVDEPFQPTFDGNVSVIKVLANGQILVGGSFQHVNGQLRPGLARLNIDGTLDGSFDAVVSGGVFALLVQPDSKIILAGWFSQVGGQSRGNIARLNADGTLDTSFNPGWGADGWVNALGLLSDGRVMLAGHFTGVDTYANYHIARLNADGSRDASFVPSANGDVRAMVVQANDQVVIGGEFTQVNGQTRNRIARLNTDGSLDTSYKFSADGSVDVLALQADGKILANGHFKNMDNGSVAMNFRFIRLNPDNTFDDRFIPLMLSSEFINAIAIQKDGKIVAGGNFTNISSQPMMHVARFNTNGTLDARIHSDPTFQGSANDYVQVVKQLPNGQMLIGGRFTSASNWPANLLARLNSDGTIDKTFQIGLGSGAAWTGSVINDVAIQPDGKIIIVGQFIDYYRRPNGNIYRLNPDGSIDWSFNYSQIFPNGNDTIVNSVELQPDGKIIVGGTFLYNNNGHLYTNIARLNANGGFDTSFGATTPAEAKDITALPDGNIMVGVNGNYGTLAGQEIGSLVRLHSDGGIDTTFTPLVDGWVSALQLQADGKLLVCGAFTHIAGQPFKNLARLNMDGSLDITFQPSVNYETKAIAQQADGKLIVAGSFNKVDAIPHFGIVRLEQNGRLDPSFTAGTAGVNSIVVQPDGRIILAGGFYYVEGQRVNRLARLYPYAQ